MLIVCPIRRVLVETEEIERTLPALLQDLGADAATLVRWVRQQAGCESAGLVFARRLQR